MNVVTLSSVATREEVEALKANWSNDPCWDLEDSGEQFEPYRSELLHYRLAQEAHWSEQRRARLLKKAESIGCPGNTTLAAYIERLENKIEKLEVGR